MSENGAFLSSENGAFSQSENEARGGGEAGVIPTIGHKFALIEHAPEFVDLVGSKQTATYFLREEGGFWLERAWVGGGTSPPQWLLWWGEWTDGTKNSRQAAYESEGAVFTTYTHDEFYNNLPAPDERFYPVMSKTPKTLVSIPTQFAIYPGFAEGRGTEQFSNPNWGLAPSRYPRWTNAGIDLTPNQPAGEKWWIKDEIGPDNWEVTSKEHFGTELGRIYRNTTTQVSYPAKDPTIQIVGGQIIDTTNLGRFTFLGDGFITDSRPVALSDADGFETNLHEQADWINANVVGFNNSTYAVLGGDWYWTYRAGPNEHDFYHPSAYNPLATPELFLVFGKI